MALAISEHGFREIQSDRAETAYLFCIVIETGLISALRWKIQTLYWRFSNRLISLWSLKSPQSARLQSYACTDAGLVLRQAYIRCASACADFLSARGEGLSPTGRRQSTRNIKPCCCRASVSEKGQDRICMAKKSCSQKRFLKFLLSARTNFSA